MALQPTINFLPRVSNETKRDSSGFLPRTEPQFTIVDAIRGIDSVLGRLGRKLEESPEPFTRFTGELLPKSSLDIGAELFLGPLAAGLQRFGKDALAVVYARFPSIKGLLPKSLEEARQLVASLGLADKVHIGRRALVGDKESIGKLLQELGLLHSDVEHIAKYAERLGDTEADILNRFPSPQAAENAFRVVSPIGNYATRNKAISMKPLGSNNSPIQFPRGHLPPVGNEMFDTKRWMEKAGFDFRFVENPGSLAWRQAFRLANNKVPSESIPKASESVLSAIPLSEVVYIPDSKIYNALRYLEEKGLFTSAPLAVGPFMPLSEARRVAEIMKNFKGYRGLPKDKVRAVGNYLDNKAIMLPEVNTETGNVVKIKGDDVVKINRFLKSIGIDYSVGSYTTSDMVVKNLLNLLDIYYDSGRGNRSIYKKLVEVRSILSDLRRR